jgi:hypothetical protein
MLSRPTPSFAMSACPRVIFVELLTTTPTVMMDTTSSRLLLLTTDDLLPLPLLPLTTDHRLLLLLPLTTESYQRRPTWTRMMLTTTWTPQDLADFVVCTRKHMHSGYLRDLQENVLQRQKIVFLLTIACFLDVIDDDEYEWKHEHTMDTTPDTHDVSPKYDCAAPSAALLSTVGSLSSLQTLFLLDRSNSLSCSNCGAINLGV